MPRKSTKSVLGKILKIGGMPITDNATSIITSGVNYEKEKPKKKPRKRRKGYKSQIEKIKQSNPLYQRVLQSGVEKPSRGKKSARTKKRKKIKSLQGRIREERIIQKSAIYKRNLKKEQERIEQEKRKEQSKLLQKATKRKSKLTKEDKLEGKFKGDSIKEKDYTIYYIDNFISQVTGWLDAPQAMIDKITGAINKLRNALGDKHAFNILQDFINTHGIKTIWDLYRLAYLEGYIDDILSDFTYSGNESEIRDAKEHFNTFSNNLGDTY